MTSRTAIVVLGMHRSGTSALTRMLSLLGASLSGNLNPPGTGNETGHWEPQAANNLNDQILGLAGSSIHDVHGPSDEWLQTPAAQAFVAGLKDLIVDEYGRSVLGTGECFARRLSAPIGAGFLAFTADRSTLPFYFERFGSAYRAAQRSLWSTC